jgi:peptidoglycan hydrolase CwlO-like protein
MTYDEVLRYADPKTELEVRLVDIIKYDEVVNVAEANEELQGEIEAADNSIFELNEDVQNMSGEIVSLKKLLDENNIDYSDI